MFRPCAVDKAIDVGETMHTVVETRLVTAYFQKLVSRLREAWPGAYRQHQPQNSISHALLCCTFVVAAEPAASSAGSVLIDEVGAAIRQNPITADDLMGRNINLQIVVSSARETEIRKARESLAQLQRRAVVSTFGSRHQ